MPVETNHDDEMIPPPLGGEGVELLEMKNGKKKEDSVKMRPEQGGDELHQNSKYATAILLLTVICTVPMINYGLTCLNPALPVLKQMINNTYQKRNSEVLTESGWKTQESLIMSIIVAGAFVGSISVKTLLTIISRKQLMILLHSTNIVGALVIAMGSGLTGSPEALIFGRFIMGIANGLALGIVPVIIGETCVKHKCAFYDGLIGVSLAIGALLGVIMGWSQVFGTATLWPLIVITPAVPSVVYLVVSRWVLNTPYYAARHSDRSEVKKILEAMREGPKSALAAELDTIVGESSHDSLIDDEESNQAGVKKDAAFMDIIKNKQYRRQFIMVLMMFANLMLNGLNNIMFYSDKIFLDAGIAKDMVTIVTICVFLFQVISTLPGSFILHRFGSWKLCIIGNIIMIIGQVLLVASLATQKTNPAMSYVAIIGVAVFLLGFAGGENIAVFPLVGELTTEVTRPICVNFGCATLWFFGWLVGFMSTYLKAWMGAYSFLIWMAFTILFTCYIAFAVPNPRVKSSEEIQRHFNR